MLAPQLTKAEKERDWVAASSVCEKILMLAPMLKGDQMDKVIANIKQKHAVYAGRVKQGGSSFDQPSVMAVGRGSQAATPTPAVFAAEQKETQKDFLGLAKKVNQAEKDQAWDIAASYCEELLLLAPKLGHPKYDPLVAKFRQKQALFNSKIGEERKQAAVSAPALAVGLVDRFLALKGSGPPAETEKATPVSSSSLPAVAATSLKTEQKAVAPVPVPMPAVVSCKIDPPGAVQAPAGPTEEQQQAVASFEELFAELAEVEAEEDWIGAESYCEEILMLAPMLQFDTKITPILEKIKNKQALYAARANGEETPAVVESLSVIVESPSAMPAKTMPQEVVPTPVPIPAASAEEKEAMANFKELYAELVASEKEEDWIGASCYSEEILELAPFFKGDAKMTKLFGEIKQKDSAFKAKLGGDDWLPEGIR
jgi:putative methionine-R-sulfoxide reductase with GAF domain